ncbi:DUF4279 domain-containing protein [Siphonobacter sp. SORGH_AS_1065]|uniref:DUF4279 domain-containing protein n=1 Tax=Siphonobacter sp. SORGH_AS_1065 TaxID=3041795 RepID=UPI0027828970|nr:DUF4279 domain-containing protein [Siphonobacter sp. SORGH_AS_1065]MDQ1087524.1 hypothetical protein [Siphonobacter sp. SORGH_AS_1065]
MDEFLTEISCEFIITSNQLSHHQITSLLNIQPTRAFNKGETSVSKHSGSILTRPHTLWAFKTEVLRSEWIDPSMSQHLTLLTSIFAAKQSLLEELKDRFECERCLFIWINTEESGLGMDIKSSDLSIINSLVDHWHFTVIPNCTFE